MSLVKLIELYATLNGILKRVMITSLYWCSSLLRSVRLNPLKFSISGLTMISLLRLSKEFGEYRLQAV